MKPGLSLVELAGQIEANRELKRDFVASTEKLEVAVQSDNKVVLGIAGAPGGDVQLPILPVAHSQIGTHTGIPSKYYDRMLVEQPKLLADNVNTWLRTQKPVKRMVRSLGGDARAFLSNRYQRIENEDIAEVVLPILRDIPGVRIVSSQITEKRMYIQAVTPKTEAVRVGDEVQAGVIISNSEVGLGSVSIKPMIFRLVCLNGLVLDDGKLVAKHVGRRIDDMEELYQDDTRAADDKAVLLKVRDHVRAAVDEVRFRKQVEQMAEFAGARVTGDPSAAVEVLAQKVGATDGERKGILRSLIESGGDLTAWGMINAVTHQAHTLENYDRAVEFEGMGGRLLNLPKSEWRQILEAEAA